MTPKSRSSFATSPTDSNPESLLNLASILPPLPPKFPSFMELVRLEAETQATPPPKKGLFDGLVGQVEPLYEDSLEHPEKFKEEAVLLLHDLVAGAKTLKGLSAAEQEILDLATIDFASSPTKGRPAPRTPRADAPRPEAESSLPIPGVDVPAGEQGAYWWLK